MLRAVVDAAAELGGCPAVFGGIAVGVRGRWRYTDDVDAILDVAEARWPEMIAAFTKRGATLPENALDRLRRNAMLPMKIDGVKVDILLPADELSREAFDRATSTSALGLRVVVAQAEELIAMKLLAGRVQDVQDLKTLLSANRGKLDFARIERWFPDIEAWRPGSTAQFDSLKREFYDPLPPP